MWNLREPSFGALVATGAEQHRPQWLNVWEQVAWETGDGDTCKCAKLAMFAKLPMLVVSSAAVPPWLVLVQIESLLRHSSADCSLFNWLLNIKYGNRDFNYCGKILMVSKNASQIRRKNMYDFMKFTFIATVRQPSQTHIPWYLDIWSWYDLLSFNCSAVSAILNTL